jgi:hypothetical protein
MKVDFASIKLSRSFVAWLKRESARRGVPMYELVEQLVARGMPQRPWDPTGSAKTAASIVKL